MGRLSTHVLDLAAGKPAAGVTWSLYKLDKRRKKICSGKTNEDGRTDQPLLGPDEMKTGVYEIVFDIAKYFAAKESGDFGMAFLDSIPIRFQIADGDQNYHVPLLVAPYGYSTYRGS